MEKRYFGNEETSSDNGMSIFYDAVRGAVYACSAGLWSLDQTKAFFTEWNSIVARIHQSGKSVTAFIDMSKAAVQTAAVAEYVAGANTDIHKAGDALALLVPSTLVKLQVRRVVDARYNMVFNEAAGAKAWLEEHWPRGCEIDMPLCLELPG